MARKTSLSLELNGVDGLIVGAPRLMWLFVAYDLPVGTRKQRRDATNFHKTLENLGFQRLQFSLYRKFCGTHATMDSLSRNVVQGIPKSGKVAILPLTDKQIARMILYENRTKKSSPGAPEQLLLL